MQKSQTAPHTTRSVERRLIPASASSFSPDSTFSPGSCTARSMPTGSPRCRPLPRQTALHMGKEVTHRSITAHSTSFDSECHEPENEYAALGTPMLIPTHPYA